MKLDSNFKPAWWLRNCHLQTMAGKLLRKNLHLDTITETVETPDGDFVELAWTEDPAHSAQKPIVFVLHGLEGSIDSHYAKGMMAAIKQRGWIAVLMHFRGCSGKPNRHGPSYHSGDTYDVHYCVHYLQQRFANRQLAILGFSLGGNVLANYLAQDQHTPFQASAIICAPLHLHSCSTRISQGFSKVYQKYLVDMLKASTLTKIELGLINHIDKEALRNIRLLADFDESVTAPIHGFDSAIDYYEKVSGLYQLAQIRTPTLVLHALDDPFLCHQFIDKLPESRYLTYEISKRGGHVGFIGGHNPLKPSYYIEQRVLDYFEQTWPQAL
ncbi:hydrolase [Thalassotalea ponticola]|uniref:hydrolase n=1 Tax=Thalassotalea ponticola TaxID=1523392 RepID=UPI0025B35EC4|nr:hydrolase [Thalassotalea ponticola]MDN3652815.1 hydrolase [Thalassotalea ponticola]